MLCNKCIHKDVCRVYAKFLNLNLQRELPEHVRIEITACKFYKQTQ